MAEDPKNRIKELEDELSKTKYNKRTQRAIGLLKAKIARLKDKEVARSSKKTISEGYSVRKTGDGTVIMVGFPSVGKSTLLNALTNAKSEVGSYAFTTLKVIPGLMEYEGAKIQVLDVPGVVHGAASGKGRGKEVLSVMRNANLAMIVLEVLHPEHLDVLLKEIYDSGLRLNQRKPDVKIMKKNKGGIVTSSTIKKLSWLDSKTVEDICKEFRIINADVLIREDITPDQLIDVIEDNKVYIPSLVVINKIDSVHKEKLDKVKKKVNADILVSGEKDINISNLKESIFKKLDLIKVFCKDPGKKADLDEPLIMSKSSSVEDMCNKLHRDFTKRFRFVRVWGKSAKFPGQRKMLNHTLEDGDVIEIHLK